jgi:hypothetical protein
MRRLQPVARIHQVFKMGYVGVVVRVGLITKFLDFGIRVRWRKADVGVSLVA